MLPRIPTLQPDKNIPDFPRNDAAYIYEPKFDGIRALCYYEQGMDQVELVSRTKKHVENVSDGFKQDLAKLLSFYPSIILDGELIAVDKEYLSGNFNGLQNRLNSPTLLQYRCFDLLYLDGADLRAYKTIQRKKLLDYKVKINTLNFRLVPWANSIDELEGRLTNGYSHLEGYVAKQKSAKYESGRQRTWIKIKQRETVTVIVTGWVQGTGKWQDTFGALEISEFKQDPKTKAVEVKSVGQVGTGWTDAERYDLHQLVTAENFKPFPIEISYQFKTVSGKVAMASFSRLTSIE